MLTVVDPGDNQEIVVESDDADVATSFLVEYLHRTATEWYRNVVLAWWVGVSVSDYVATRAIEPRTIRHVSQDSTRRSTPLSIDGDTWTWVGN